MLLILIPIAWLAVVTLFVAVCQASAGEESAAASEEPGYRVRDGLVVWDRDAAISLRYGSGGARSLAPSQAPLEDAPRAPRRGRFAIPGVR
jgi:hypothetical protein